MWIYFICMESTRLTIFTRDKIHPVMCRLREHGKIRFIGITEAFAPDPSHCMLGPAVQKDPHLWDVVMVGFNLLNPSAGKTVLPSTMRHGVGTLCMFAVRRALSQPAALAELVAKLVADGAIPHGEMPAESPLDFLIHPDAAGSIPEAAYRFCLHEPGMDVILSGSGNPEHLRKNALFLGRPELPQPTLARLHEIFKNVDWVSGISCLSTEAEFLIGNDNLLSWSPSSFEPSSLFSRQFVC